jgi:outer membrane protein TolC
MRRVRTPAASTGRADARLWSLPMSSDSFAFARGTFAPLSPRRFVQGLAAGSAVAGLGFVPMRRIALLVLCLCMSATIPVSKADDQLEQLPAQLDDLLQEAMANSPELAAARSERDAAQQRIAPAGALEDPMLELGVVNAPLDPLSLGREDMTMKMLGLSQKLPFPGKRDLRRAVATADADSLDLAVQETTNRLLRDVRVAYAELSFNAESQRIVSRTNATLEQLVTTARSRYDVGQAAQSDVLDAQTELERLSVEQLQLTSENAVLQSELRRLLGRTEGAAVINTPAPELVTLIAADLVVEDRPQLRALQALVERNSRSIELAEREFYPDFDVTLQYGQRDRTPDGMPRDDMVSLVVGLNLPIWRKSRLEPQVAEARAMRSQAQSMLAAQQFETRAALEAQLTLAARLRQTVQIYENSLLPQVRASVASALAAYRVGNVDFLTLRQAQLREFEVSTELAEAIANHNKAVAEIELLVGRSLP